VTEFDHLTSTPGFHEACRESADLLRRIWEQFETRGLVGQQADYLARQGTRGWMPRLLTEQGRALISEVEDLRRARLGLPPEPAFGVGFHHGTLEEVEEGIRAALMEAIEQLGDEHLRDRTAAVDLVERDLGVLLLRFRAFASEVTPTFDLIEDMRRLGLANRTAPAVVDGVAGWTHLDPVPFLRRFPGGPTPAEWGAIQDAVEGIRRHAQEGATESDLRREVGEAAPWLDVLARGVLADLTVRPVLMQPVAAAEVLSPTKEPAGRGHRPVATAPANPVVAAFKLAGCALVGSVGLGIVAGAVAAPFREAAFVESVEGGAAVGFAIWGGLFVLGMVGTVLRLVDEGKREDAAAEMMRRR